MKAAILRSYGGPESLVVQQLPDPSPKADELRVRVRATTVTRGDTELRTFSIPWLFRIPLRLWLGLFRPRGSTVLGMEFAGTVESVGDAVSSYTPGDEVFGSCGMGFGGYAELVCVPASGVMASKPDAVSSPDAAALSVGAMAALGYLKRAGVERAKRVLIRGASGSIGSYAVQLAKYYGAHVTGICPPQGLELVKELGADEVVDYTRTDFTQGPERYDLLLDVVGGMSMKACLDVLNEGGSYVRATIPSLTELLQAAWLARKTGKKVVMGDHGESVEELEFLVGLVEQGKLRTVVDRTYRLDQIVEAHAYVEQGHKQGNVIVTMDASAAG